MLVLFKLFWFRVNLFLLGFVAAYTILHFQINLIGFVILPVECFSNHTIFKHHLVASQCTGFVAKDIFDLAQLFIYRGGLCSSKFIPLCNIHLVILLNEIRLEHFDEF